MSDRPDPSPTASDALEATSAFLVETDHVPTVAEEVHDTVTTLLPWGIAITMWLGIILLSAFVTFSIIRLQEIEERSVPKVSLHAPPDIAIVDPVQDEQIEEPAPNPDPTPTPESNPDPTPTTTTDIPILGLAGLSAAGSPGLSTGAGLGAKQVQFFGSEAQAGRIVFLVDASGSLLDVFPKVLQELQKSINDLQATQRFTVIFFLGQSTGRQVLIELPPGRGLTESSKATAERKNEASRWLDPQGNNVVPAFQGDPVAALRKALQYRPELIFLMSDNITGAGRFEVDQQRLLAGIRRANVNGTQINTIQFLYRDPLEHREGGRLIRKGTLQLIAEQNGSGDYRFLDERALGL